MTDKDLKLILGAGGPERLAPEDPARSQAEAALAENAELRAALRREQEFDAVVRGRLREAEPPAELLGQILAGRKVLRPRFGGWPSAAALAAALALLLGIAGLFVSGVLGPNARNFAGYRASVAKYLSGMESLELYSSDRAEIREWLRRNAGLADIPGPERWGQEPLVGCTPIPWRGKKAVLICYRIEGQIVHLVAIPASAMESPPGPEKIFAQLKDWNTAGWRQGEMVYLAVTSMEQAALRGRL